MISQHDEGCVLVVWAQPGARRNALQGEYRGALKVTVAAPPEDGRANAAICEVLQQTLQLKKSQITLLNGQTSREKKFLIIGISMQELQQRIASHLASTVKSK